MKNVLVLLLCLLPATVFAQGASDVTGAPRGTRLHKKAPSGLSVGTAAATAAGSVSFTGAESTMSPRIFRPGAEHTTCSTSGAGTHQFRTVSFTSDGTGSLTLTIDPGTCDGSSASYIYPTFHTAFNPADICSGFVWGPGSSPLAGSTTLGPFSVPAGTPMVMVVGAVSVAPDVVCGPVTYSITGTAAVPTMTEWGLILLSLLLAATAAWMLMLRRRLLA